MFWRALSTLYFLQLFLRSEKTQRIISKKNNTFNHPYRFKPKLLTENTALEENMMHS